MDQYYLEWDTMAGSYQLKKKQFSAGGGPDDGIQSLMTSYQSELGGLVAGLAVLGTLFLSGAMNIW
jgi:hypothetical protein